MTTGPLTKWLWVKGSVQSARLSPSARAVAFALADRLNGETGQCNPSLPRLAEDCGISLRTAKRAVADLLKAGLVERLSGGSGAGRGNHNQYALKGLPIPQKKGANPGQNRDLKGDSLVQEKVSGLSPELVKRTRRGRAGARAREDAHAHAPVPSPDRQRPLPLMRALPGGREDGAPAVDPLLAAFRRAVDGLGRGSARLLLGDARPIRLDPSQGLVIAATPAAVARIRTHAATELRLVARALGDQAGRAAFVAPPDARADVPHETDGASHG